MSSTAACSTTALLPQTRQLRFQHLQPVQDILDVWQLVVATTCLLGDVDAVGENNLIVTIHRVLHVLGVHWGALVFDVFASRRVKVNRAEGRGGDIDVVDMVEYYRLVRMGQGEVLLGFLGHQCLSTVADDLHQASHGELEKQGYSHAA